MARLLTLAMVLYLTSASFAFAQQLIAKPFTFDPDNLMGTAGQWVSNMGCGLDSSGSDDQGLVLFKLGPTTDFKASGAEITKVKNMSLCASNAVLGFDFRPEGHCSGGAPRFNLVTKAGTFHFLGGCGNATTSAGPGACMTATIDPHSSAQAFPPLPTSANPNTAGCVIKSLAIIFDEGTDAGPGFAVVDNININGTIIDKE
ncbi:MAG: hypothetical protein ACRERD_23850 [Candidatus Binatia bacterium]